MLYIVPLSVWFGQTASSIPPCLNFATGRLPGLVSITTLICYSASSRNRTSRSRSSAFCAIRRRFRPARIQNKAFAATLAAIGWLAGPGLSGAMAATVNVLYSASGKFASPQISGSDGLKLAGEPFKISIVASPIRCLTRAARTEIISSLFR